MVLVAFLLFSCFQVDSFDSEIYHTKNDCPNIYAIISCSCPIVLARTLQTVLIIGVLVDIRDLLLMLMRILLVSQH